MEDSQEVRAKESHWILPPQPLLFASPWSIVLPVLQVGFLQTVSAAHSQTFQRIQLRNFGVRFRAGVQWMPLNVSMWVSAAVHAFISNTEDMRFRMPGQQEFALPFMTPESQKWNNEQCRPKVTLTQL